MKEFTVFLNLPDETSYLPEEFSFNSTDKSFFEKNEQVHFIDYVTKLNGVRAVELLHEAEEGKQHTFYARILD